MARELTDLEKEIAAAKAIVSQKKEELIKLRTANTPADQQAAAKAAVNEAKAAVVALRAKQTA